MAQNSLNFALVLLIVTKTDRALLSSLLVLALVVPATVAGIVAGAAADVLPKRTLVVLGDTVRAGICFLFIRGPGGVASYYVVAVALSTASQFATAAEGAIMPAIVQREELARANAISHAVAGGAQLLGLGVVTPVALRVFDSPDMLFILAAAMFLLAAFQALLIGRVPRAPRLEVGGEQRDRAGPWWKTGWRYMKGDPLVMHAAIELALISTALIVLGGLIPGYINDVLGLPVDIGALILMPGAIGIVFGLRVAGFLAHRVPHAILSTVGFTAFVALLAMVTFVNQESDFLIGYGMFSWLGTISVGHFDGGGALAMLLMFPLGFAYAIVAVAAQTVLNDRVPLHLQGRVNSTQNAMAAIAASAPVVAAGALSDVVGVVPVMALLAAAIGLAAAMNLRAPPTRSPRTAGALP
ncbi:MAG: MFS transporter [Chloroflexi bacterium]|nr:MFS transporter [Chloroflexota bacterium]